MPASALAAELARHLEACACPLDGELAVHLGQAAMTWKKNRLDAVAVSIETVRLLK